MRQGSIYNFSLWVLPIVIALFTAFAVFRFTPLYPPSQGETLTFRSLPLAAGHVTPQQAVEALRIIPQQNRAELQGGTWLLLELPERARQRPSAVDFPASSPQSAICWRRDTLEPLGEASGRNTTGAMRTSRLGYALMLGHVENDRGATFGSLLCRIHYGDPTVFTAKLWEISDLRAASDRLHRAIALLEGGILTLAVFLAAIAIRSREWTYLLVAVWLVGNLRLGTYAMGWDGQWLGYAVPPEWQTMLRKLTLALYYLVSHALFMYLWRPRDSHGRQLPMVLQALGITQLLAAALLPWYIFQWAGLAIWAVALVLGLYLVGRQAGQNPASVASWRALLASLAIAVAIACLLLTLLDQPTVIDSFGVISALILTNIIVALGVSGMMRIEKKNRIRVQTELVTSYAVAPLGLFTLDSRGYFQRMNPGLLHMLELPEDTSVTTKHWDDFFEAQDWEAVTRATLSGQETEIHLLSDGAGRPRHFALRAAMVGDHVEGSLQDITARAQAMAELRDQMDNDPLTQTLNRRGIEKKLERAIAGMRTRGQPCSLAYMDLDHFKRINGLFGHTSGDEILKQVTDRLRKILTRFQTLGRIGSDEFIILFPNMDASAARTTAVRIIEDLNNNTYAVGHRTFSVRSAIGVVEIHPDMDAATAISAATRACRDARKQNQDVVVYEQGSSELEAHTEELRLCDQLEGGDSPKGLYLEMQPIMSLRHPEETLDFEILLRVRDSQGRLIPTGKIVTGAEESGTITIIDKWVFSA
ncbi:MAG TPA: diguanylate cyclase, partial [Burkholderiaceae bacterium]|nr:diguanylate cyclase [Burkholderiaceae bacterium]